MSTEARLDFEGMIVTADYLDESVQPWSDKPCFRYRIHVSARGGDRVDFAYGSQVDYEQGRNDQAEEMAWMMLHDYLSAADDPNEFWSMAMGEPDLVNYERARGVLEVIDFSLKIGEVLEANRDEIESAYERY